MITNISTRETELTTALRKTGEALDACKAERDALKALITATHKAKGRYHSQIAMCDLYDAVGLFNVRPISGEK